MIGTYTITTTRTMTVLDGLQNPRDGYRVAFTWHDNKGLVRESYVELVGREIPASVVDTAIKAEIEKIETWLG